jgi:hypothetical protein
MLGTITYSYLDTNTHPPSLKFLAHLGEEAPEVELALV